MVEIMLSRGAILVVLAFVAMAVAFLLLPEIRQPAEYHDFADQGALFGIPNFWNVVSNAPFLVVAIWGAFARRAFVEPWERAAYAVVLAGAALTGFGSAYYHWNPNDATLFWDRLPMTLVFMGIFAPILGERKLLAPLILLGAGSVVYWRWTGDLRAYVLVQFVPCSPFPCCCWRAGSATPPPAFSGRPRDSTSSPRCSNLPTTRSVVVTPGSTSPRQSRSSATAFT